MPAPLMLEHVPPFSHLRENGLTWSIAICSAFAFTLFGYDQGVLGGLTTQPSFLSAMGNPTPTQLGLIAAIYDIGAFVGAVLAAIFGMMTGRRWAIVIGCVLVTAGAAIQASANGMGHMIAGRIIAGIGNGINTSTIPTWVSETAKPHHRGSLVATQLSIVVLGLFFAYWLDYGCVKHLTGGVVWRLPIAMQAVFSVLTLFTIVFLPESPRWLYAKGLTAEGDLVISRLKGIALDDPKVASQRETILEVVRLEESNASTGLNWKHIIFDPTDIKPTRRIVLGVMLQFLQVFSGISLAVYYLNILFEKSLKFDYEKAALLSGFNTFILWIGTLPPIWLVEKFGRRQVLMFGSITMAMSMITFTVCVAVGNHTSAYVGVVAIYAYMFFFGLSWQPVPWIYPPEITPLRLRHVGAAAAAGSEWIFAFTAVMAGPVAIAAVPWLMYFIFSVCTVFAVPFVYFCVPETRGLSLEELDFVFQEGPARTSGKRNRAELRRRLAAGGGADAEATGVAARHVQHAQGHSTPSASEDEKAGEMQHVDLVQKA